MLSIINAAATQDEDGTTAVVKNRVHSEDSKVLPPGVWILPVDLTSGRVLCGLPVLSDLKNRQTLMTGVLINRYRFFSSGDGQRKIDLGNYDHQIFLVADRVLFFYLSLIMMR